MELQDILLAAGSLEGFYASRVILRCRLAHLLAFASVVPPARNTLFPPLCLTKLYSFMVS